MNKKPFKLYKPKVIAKEYKPERYDPTAGISPNLNFLNEGEQPYVKVPEKPIRDFKKEKKDI